MSSLVNRRTFLRGAAAGAGLAVAGPVLGGLPGAFAAGRPLARPDSRPYPSLPAGADTLPHIEHLIYLVMENHSFDNYFGMLGRGDGFTLGRNGRPANWNADRTGRRVYSYHAPSPCTADYDIGQDWVRSHTAWNQGRNDGFLRLATRNNDAMAYFTAEDIPFYYSLARTFPVCDRYHCSLMGQTDPNRKFMLAATSFGQVNDSSFQGIITQPAPPNGTIFDRLNAYGISWKDYFVDTPTSAGLFPTVGESNPDKCAPIAEFFADCAAGSLPSVSYVDPDGWQGSEENPQDIDTGEYFAYRVISAVLDSPAWSKTMLLLTWDEHGGYYDHVPPAPMVPPDGLKPETSETFGDHFSWSGFRVPAIIVSPWSRRNYVSHVVHDHTSFLKLVETKWNLPALTYRDANASNLLDSLDFSRPSFAEPPILAAAPIPTGAPGCYATDPTSPV